MDVLKRNENTLFIFSYKCNRWICKFLSLCQYSNCFEPYKMTPGWHLATEKFLTLVIDSQGFQKRSWKQCSPTWREFLILALITRTNKQKKLSSSLARAKEPSGSTDPASGPSNPTVVLEKGHLYWKENSAFLMLLYLMASYSTQRLLECKDMEKKIIRTAKVLTTGLGSENVKICETNEMWWNNTGKHWQKNIFAETIWLLK